MQGGDRAGGGRIERDQGAYSARHSTPEAAAAWSSSVNLRTACVRLIARPAPGEHEWSSRKQLVWPWRSGKDLIIIHEICLASAVRNLS